MLVVDSKSNLVTAKMAYSTKSQWETTHILLKSERKGGGEMNCRINARWMLQITRNSEIAKAKKQFQQTFELKCWETSAKNNREIARDVTGL